MPTNYGNQIAQSSAYNGRLEFKPVPEKSRVKFSQMSIGCPGRCWCGEIVGHDWPGKSDKKPHPRG